MTGAASLEQDIRFCRAVDGVRIAYASLGRGPTVVQALGWLTHLELGWNAPQRPWFYQLAASHRIVLYDGRGVGLSDRAVTDFSLDAKLRDLEAVIDAAGVRRTALVGVSEGGATAVLYAARHPERVSHLVLYDASTRPPTVQSPDMLRAMGTIIRAGWGQDTSAFRQLFTNVFYPDADAAFVEGFTLLQRLSASAETAERYWDAACSIDVRALLPTLTVPTLVIHRRGDQAIPLEEGRELAAAIPGARLHILEGRNHVPLATEPEYTLLPQAIVAFVAAETTAPAGLSRREVEVLRLLAAGKSNQEIADQLVITLRTAGYHVTNVLTKLGVANRTEAAAFAYRQGLLDGPA